MDLIQANKDRLNYQLNLYQKRQAIVEHPYGVIKRQWDFYYIMTKKTIAHATADVGLIFTAYNLRRIFNILDKNTLKNYLRGFDPNFLALKSFFKHFRATFYFTPSNSTFATAA